MTTKVNFRNLVIFGVMLIVLAVMIWILRIEFPFNLILGGVSGFTTSAVFPWFDYDY